MLEIITVGLGIIAAVAFITVLFPLTIILTVRNMRAMSAQRAEESPYHSPFENKQYLNRILMNIEKRSQRVNKDTPEM